MIRTLTKTGLLLVGLIYLTAQAIAQPSPVGRWVTIDDDTGKPKSVVEITESEGNLMGQVVELLSPPKYPGDPRLCTECTGERHNMPIKGMMVMWGYKFKNGKWQDGEILDPNNGKIYRSLLTVKPDGKRLKVRGYIGLSWIGRTQEWIKESDWKEQQKPKN